MLTIRREQLELLQRLPRLGFESELIEFVRRHYEPEYEALGRDQVRALVRQVISRAEAMGFRTKRQVSYYLSLMLLLGAEFDDDVQLPWIRRALSDASAGDPGARILRAWEETIDYLAATAGEQNELLDQALRRVHSYDLSAAPTSSGEAFESELCELLRSFYPEKWAHQGEEATRRLIQDGIELARSYEITRQDGIVLFVTLMFIFGSGFHDDPLFPWAGDILDDLDIGSQDVRIERLHAAAVDCLDAALAEG